MIKGSAIVFDNFRNESTEQRISQVVKISRGGSRFITDRYEQMLQDLELLQGACPSVVLLGVAIFLDLKIAPSLGGSSAYGKIVFGIAAVLIIALAPFFLYLISKTREDMKELAKQAEAVKVSRSDDTAKSGLNSEIEVWYR